MHRSPSRGPVAVLFLALLLSTAGCEWLRDIWAFRQALVDEFDVSQVEINHHTSSSGSSLTISFRGDDVASLSHDERAALALRVALFTRDRYARFDGLTEVVIEFPDVTSVGPVTVTRESGSFRYLAADLAGPEPPGPAPPDTP